MEPSYLLHFLLALWSVLTGLFFGFVYEFFKLLHCLHPRVKWLLFIEDLLFSLLCTLGLLLLFFNLSFGRMRLYAFVGFGIGFLCWYQTAGRLFRKLLTKCLQRIRPKCAYAHAWMYTLREASRVKRLSRRAFLAIKTLKLRKGTGRKNGTQT